MFEDADIIYYYDKCKFAHVAARSFASGRLLAHPSVHAQVRAILSATMEDRIEADEYATRRDSAIDLLDRWIDDPSLIYQRCEAFDADLSMLKLLIKVIALQKADEPLMWEIEVDDA